MQPNIFSISQHHTKRKTATQAPINYIVYSCLQLCFETPHHVNRSITSELGVIGSYEYLKASIAEGLAADTLRIEKGIGSSA
jgi:hypothetical protein